MHNVNSICKWPRHSTYHKCMRSWITESEIFYELLQSDNKIVFVIWTFSLPSSENIINLFIWLLLSFLMICQDAYFLHYVKPVSYDLIIVYIYIWFSRSGWTKITKCILSNYRIVFLSKHVYHFLVSLARIVLTRSFL